VSDKRKMCEMCRKTSIRGTKTEKGKANQKAYRKKYALTEGGKAAMKRYNASQAHKDARKRYDCSEKGRAASRRIEKAREKTEKRKASHARFRTSAKGRMCQKRNRDRPMVRLSDSLRGMVAGTNVAPITFKELGIFESNADAQAHFESTFAPWMNWQNHSRCTKETLPNTLWHIGHRIPKAWYRHEDVEEQKKCWSRLNLFAQCAVENIQAGFRNMLTREQWLALKPIWPKQCAFMTHEEAWAWARDNVDNRVRRAERKAHES